ncbi:MAG: DNA polymerase III subunit gamma/tau [Clostridia bacterium]|nr:DNA polymerase III subunit gamma/tau [Clostridia bacterium]
MSEYKALYRKWRPSVFSDVIGQEHITSILKNEVMAGSVSHAYLFCGSRGTGKTTCAKILSKAVSCENPIDGDPCGKCSYCRAAESTLDIYEIDAASHNGVDNIRELRDTVVYPPSEMKRRVYIIDEVHMLSDGAFNALLKTLEEPPAHALFILATTELRKIPATILSRCKRFDFHRITAEKICERLRLIADDEGIKITDSALMLISRLAAGAMRDALSMLELFIMSDHEVDEAEASERLGVVGRSVVFSLLDAVCNKDSSRALDIISEAYDNSKDLSVLCSELSDTLRDVLIAKYVKEPSKLIDATGADIDTVCGFASRLSDEKIIFCSDICEDMQNRLSRAVFSRRTIIETGILKMCEERLSRDSATLLTRIAALEEKLNTLMRNGVPAAPSATVPTATAAPTPQNEAQAYEEQIPEAQFSDSDVPPMPSDDDIPFDGPFTDDVPPEPKKTVPKPIAPRPLTPRPIAAAPSGGASDRKPMASYAEFVEETEAVDKMAASMLEGGRAYISGGNVCELELANPIAPLMLSKSDKNAVITSALEKILGFAPVVKISYVKAETAAPLPDLSSLL